MQGFRILIVLWTFVVSLCNELTRPKIKLAIWGPQGLLTDLGKNWMPINIGNFGKVPWGKSFIGHVYPAEPDDACSPLKPLKVVQDETAPIVIARRGSCSFVTKVHYAQIQGAKMLIIVDYRDEDVMYLEMIDDNSGIGQKLNIPGVLVTRKEGEKIFLYANLYNKDPENTPAVSIAARFAWEKSENVIYEAWISPRDKTSYSFLSRFSEYGSRLVGLASFQPHFIIWHCAHCEADHYSKKDENCLSGGRYCAPDPDKSGPLKGSDVMMESLRQICIFSMSNVDFFNYTREYYRLCFDDKLSDLEACSRRAAEAAQVNDRDSIEKCVDLSFKRQPGSNYDLSLDENEILSKEKSYYFERGVAVWPSVVINDVLYKGGLNEIALFQTLCASFKRSPDVCIGSGGIVNPATVSADINHYRRNAQFWKFFAGLVLLLILFMVCFFLIYRRIVRRAMVIEMTAEINAKVSQYFKLEDPQSDLA